MALAHFAVSVFERCAKASGEAGAVSNPNAENLSKVALSATAAFAAELTFWMMSVGVTCSCSQESMPNSKI